MPLWRFLSWKKLGLSNGEASASPRVKAPHASEKKIGGQRAGTCLGLLAPPGPSEANPPLLHTGEVSPPLSTVCPRSVRLDDDLRAKRGMVPGSFGPAKPGGQEKSDQNIQGVAGEGALYAPPLLQQRWFAFWTYEYVVRDGKKY